MRRRKRVGGRERRKNLEGGEEKGKTQRRKLKSRCDDRRGWGGRFSDTHFDPAS